MVARLQVKASQIGKILQTLENKNKSEARDGGGTIKKSSTSGLHGLSSIGSGSGASKGKGESSGPPMKKPHYIDPIPPFNANKIRKSPSVTTPSESTNPAAVAAATSATISTTSVIAGDPAKTDDKEK